MGESILDDLGLYLQSLGLGVLGTTLFQGAIPLDSPSILVHDALMALIEVAGLPTLDVHDGMAASVEQPMIQIVTRSLPHDYVEARDRADAVYLALNGLTNVTLDGTRYLWLWAQQPPFLRQIDPMGRFHLVFTVRCGKEIA